MNILLKDGLIRENQIVIAIFHPNSKQLVYLINYLIILDIKFGIYKKNTDIYLIIQANDLMDIRVNLSLILEIRRFDFKYIDRDKFIRFEIEDKEQKIVTKKKKIFTEIKSESSKETKTIIQKLIEFFKNIFKKKSS